MLAMDVADTLLRREHLALGDDNADILPRLRQVYASQGIETSDTQLLDGIAALRDDRFAFRPRDSGLPVMMARIYISRARWGKWALAGIALLLIGAGTFYFRTTLVGG